MVGKRPDQGDVVSGGGGDWAVREVKAEQLETANPKPTDGLPSVREQLRTLVRRLASQLVVLPLSDLWLFYGC